MESIERSSSLPISAEAAWARVVTEQGINDELAPWLRMTMPKRLRGRTIDDVAAEVLAGEGELGRSWILLFGVLPVDYDDLRIVELEPGRSFDERSQTLAFCVWLHHRAIESSGPDSCLVTDRLGFELRAVPARIPGAARLAGAIVGALFTHRHRRLRQFARTRASTMPR